MQVAITVNGVVHERDVDPRTYWFIFCVKSWI